MSNNNNPLDIKVRLDHKCNPFTVDNNGSVYIDLLHNRLEVAERLAKDVKELNPLWPSLGAGRLANLQELAAKILDKSYES